MNLSCVMKCVFFFSSKLFITPSLILQSAVIYAVMSINETVQLYYLILLNAINIFIAPIDFEVSLKPC